MENGFEDTSTEPPAGNRMMSHGFTLAASDDDIKSLAVICSWHPSCLGGARPTPSRQVLSNTLEGLPYRDIEGLRSEPVVDNWGR